MKFISIHISLEEFATRDNNMLLLTNCEVRRAKCLDRSFEGTRMKRGSYEKRRSEYFPYGTNSSFMDRSFEGGPE